jgi:pimeloyl-ACP methyl ester carboxylesterase
MASVKIGRNVVGHDIGSMVAHALVRSHPSVVRGAIILDQVIPGIDGWEEIQGSPAVWHMSAGISRSVRERGNWAPILETLKCR